MQHQRARRGPRGVALAAGLTLLVAACGADSGGDTSGEPGATAASEPTRGGTLRYGIEGEAGGLNPTNDALAAGGLLMAHAVFDPLAAYDEEGRARPYLAESFEPSDDLTEWTITLREGVTFHDGTPLDAEAVRFNLETQAADPLLGQAIQPVVAAQDPVEVVDDRTLVVRMAEPNAHFPAHLTTQYGLVASPRWLQAALDDPGLDQEPVGTGPFRFERRLEDGTTEVVRNDEWWNGEVYLDGVDFVVQTDPARRTDSLLAGDTHVIHTDHPNEVERLRARDDVVDNIDEQGEELFVLLNTDRAPFDDIRAREALTLATPRQDYQELLGVGITTPADTMFHPDSRWHVPGVEQETDDPEAAAALVGEYCADVPEQCDDGRIRMTYSYLAGSEADNLTADVLVAGWEDSFAVERDPMPQDSIITAAAVGEYQSALWRQFGAPEPEVDRIFLDCATIGPISLNWPRYCNETVQAALDEQRAIDDFERRRDLWHTVVTELEEEAVYVFLTHSMWDVAHRREVRGLADATLPDGSAALATTNGVHSLAHVHLAP